MSHLVTRVCVIGAPVSAMQDGLLCSASSNAASGAQYVPSHGAPSKTGRRDFAVALPILADTSQAQVAVKKVAVKRLTL